MGIETRTSGSSGQCLTNWARQESVGQEISEVSFVCFMHHFTCWTLFISRISRAWLYKGNEDSGWQLNIDLAQLVRHWPEDLEFLVSNPPGGNFWQLFFCFNLCKDLSDNLTETPIVKKLTKFDWNTSKWQSTSRYPFHKLWLATLHLFSMKSNETRMEGCNFIKFLIHYSHTKLWSSKNIKYLFCALKNIFNKVKYLCARHLHCEERKRNLHC